MKSKLYTLITLLLLPLWTEAQTIEEASLKVDSLFAKYNLNTPGVAVGVLKHGEFIYKKGFGTSNLEYGVPNTEKSVFHVASVSKQFTAFAIYLLESRRLLSLEDDIRKFFPQLPQYNHQIKIKHLLGHTSGLREQFALLTLAGWDMTDHITTDHILKLAFAQKSLNFSPGSQLAYNNTGYTLLAEIVERVSGMTMNEFCTDNIFKPLKMMNTQFYDDAKKVVKNRAYSYEVKDGTYVKKKLNYSMVGATSLFTTVEDLAKWASNFDQPIVGDKKLLDKFNAVSRLNNDEPAIWRVIKADTLLHAKGQFIRNYRGVKVYKHGGHDAGYRTFLARFPEEGLTIITLSNDEHYEIFARGMEIAEFYLADKLKEESAFTPQSASADSEPIQYMREDLKHYLGDFVSDELDTHYRIIREGEHLVIQHQRLADMVLTQVGAGRFAGTNYYWDFEIEFTKYKGVVSGFDISNFGVKNLRFKKRE